MCRGVLTAGLLARPLLGFFLPVSMVSRGTWVDLKPSCCCDRSGSALLHHSQAHSPYSDLLWLKGNPTKHRGNAEMTRQINKVMQWCDLMMAAQGLWWRPMAGSKAGLFYGPCSNSLRWLLKQNPTIPWWFNFEKTFCWSCPRLFCAGLLPPAVTSPQRVAAERMSDKVPFIFHVKGAGLPQNKRPKVFNCLCFHRIQIHGE